MRGKKSSFYQRNAEAFFLYKMEDIGEILFFKIRIVNC